jgi:division protein CdvB (Snf7/Vps24/ESCRT-III family)
MRFSLFSIVTSLFLCFPLSTNAQEAATTSASSTESSFFGTVIENVTGITNSAVEKASSNSVLSAATEKRLTNLAANISNRLDGLNARLRQIAGRLDKRIQIQASNGYNVEPARTSLQSAYSKLDAASDQLKNIDRDVYRAFRSQDPKTEWLEVRSTYLTARDSIREAHTELKNTVMLLKSAAPTPPVATSTASST